MLMVVGNARILLDFSGHDRARILFLSFPLSFLSFPHVFSGNSVSCCSQMQEKTKENQRPWMPDRAGHDSGGAAENDRKETVVGCSGRDVIFLSMV